MLKLTHIIILVGKTDFPKVYLHLDLPGKQESTMAIEAIWFEAEMPKSDALA
jgi:hypothetical protein